ncbi:phage tail protein I [Orrella dioscoreae]|uniref:Phage tail fibers n=1 Tax=Orrella dioscoreae TaxID=1851544 RepID=A0A1C3K3A8_9BURK|nr:phage tail protein I [Orrella dioscoreae]SBT25972.1 Phage tail fibers [Orrella dioscoreae]SOE50870.1 Phage tail fibers [Orrella dioscoreae]
MPDRRTLLPPGSTALERNLSVAMADIEDVPIPVRDVRRAATVPAHLMPWLAWERSVDRWDDSWPEATKRKVLADSHRVHQLKGTVGAVRRAVEPLGYLLDVIEWWETTPPGPRGTARVAIGVLEHGITDAMYAELVRLIDDAWRLSIHRTGLEVHMEARADRRVAVASYDGDEMTVYPYQPGPIEITVSAKAAATHHTIDTITVYPQ